MGDMKTSAEIYHVAFRSEWADAAGGKPYVASGRNMTLADEGFVHCSLEHQLAGVLARHYSDVEPELLTVVVLDTSRVDADGVEVRYEDTHGAGENFPHVYGALRPTWVVRTEPVST